MGRLDNDTRGWIMCVVSGIGMPDFSFAFLLLNFANWKLSACVFGASIICVDLIIRRLGKPNFKIQESNAFLACSLSLSFGVMVCIATVANILNP
mgnify:CR=1 FL=1